jgi:hypothetical protein
MQANQVALIRSLKGAPSSILLTLLITGRSLTNKQLCTYTGYTDKTITAALEVLEMHQFTQFNGRTHGWSLAAGQLKLNLPEQLSTGYPQIDRKFSDLDALTTTTTIQIKDQESPLHTREKNVVVEEEKRSEILRSLLEPAGVGPNSTAMKNIITAGVEEKTAAAWVRYWKWWQQERERQPTGAIDGRRSFTAGLLIRVLLDGDAAPAERCGDCLELPADCYCRLISR